MAYVSGAGYITPINTAFNVPGAPFSGGGSGVAALGFTSGAVITPDGATIYLIDANVGVVPINTATHKAGAIIPVGAWPNSLAISPDGATVYVTSPHSQTVTPISTATNQAGAPIYVGGQPLSVAVSPDGKTVYVGSATGDANTRTDNGYVTPIDAATGTLGTPIAFANEPSDLAITPDGGTLYVAGYNEATLGSGGSIIPIDTATGTAGTAIPLTGDASGIVLTPDGTTGYVSDTVNSTITPFTVATNTLGTTLSAGDALGHPAVSPDGATLYIPTAYGGKYLGDLFWPGFSAVTPLGTATNTLGNPIYLFTSAIQMVLSPDQAPVAALAVTPQPHGKASFFNAAGSTAVSGRIRSYSWQFGDGTTAASTSPYQLHTYKTSGPYTATVTVTDTAGTSTHVIFTGHSVSRDGGPSAQTSTTFSVT